VKQILRNRAAVRSARLHQEASNCIAIAVGKTGGFTADLIDEAVRLNARARELARGDAKRGSLVPVDA
jgi:hypothetical protein